MKLLKQVQFQRDTLFCVQMDPDWTSPIPYEKIKILIVR